VRLKVAHTGFFCEVSVVSATFLWTARVKVLPVNVHPGAQLVSLSRIGSESSPYCEIIDGVTIEQESTEANGSGGGGASSLDPVAPQPDIPAKARPATTAVSDRVHALIEYPS
jgi:hypothetical protein